MDLLLLGILLSVTFSTVQGTTPKCCVATTKKFPLMLLQKVDRYDVQSRRGACEIDALVLHIRGQRFCANPKLEKILQYMKSQMQMQNGHTNRPV